MTMMILIIIINLSAVAGVPMLPLMRKDDGINSLRAKERRGFTLFAYESISFSAIITFLAVPKR